MDVAIIWNNKVLIKNGPQNEFVLPGSVMLGHWFVTHVWPSETVWPRGDLALNSLGIESLVLKQIPVNILQHTCITKPCNVTQHRYSVLLGCTNYCLVTRAQQAYKIWESDDQRLVHLKNGAYHWQVRSANPQINVICPELLHDGKRLGDEVENWTIKQSCHANNSMLNDQ